MNRTIIKSADSTMNLEIVKGVEQEEWYSMGKAAKLINFKKLGRTKLFQFLREQKILMNDNEPYQLYVELGYFRLVQKDVENGYGRIIARLFVTLVSMKGINFIKKQLDQIDDENGET